VVLRQADRLRNELRTVPADALAAVSPALVEQVQKHLTEAREIAEHAPRKWETLRSWWTGNAIETAWNHLQTAREDLLLIAAPAAVRAQLPSLLRRSIKLSADPGHDPQVEAIKEIAATTGELSSDQRDEIRAGECPINGGCGLVG
jgi:hypothetical protein